MLAKSVLNCGNHCFKTDGHVVFRQKIVCLFAVSFQAISFLTPLAVIFVVKIIQRTDRTEIKEACLGMWRESF